LNANCFSLERRLIHMYTDIHYQVFKRKHLFISSYQKTCIQIETIIEFESKQANFNSRELFIGNDVQS